MNNEKENPAQIFRFWTWRKFIFNFLFFMVLNLLIISLFEINDLLRNLPSFSFAKVIREVFIQSLVFSFCSTLWTPGSGDLTALIRRKLNKKRN